MTARAGALVVVLGLAMVVRGASAHPSPARPYDRARVVQRLGGGQSMSIDARWGSGAALPDPRMGGVRVRLTIEPGGGVPRVIELPPDGWEAGRAFRFAASGCDGRSIRARLRAGRRGGRFRLELPTCTTPLLPADSARLALLVALRDVRWCAELGPLRVRGRRVTGAAEAPLASCPCEPLPAATLQAIEQRIFARHGCAVLGCHGGTAGQADLSLSPGLSYASLVSVPAVMDPQRLRVLPGDPEASFLWQKLAARTLGLPGVPGLGMPIGDPPVDADELEAVRLWIAAGAPAAGSVAEADALLDCLP